MRCQYCGKEIPEGSKFCVSCGNPASQAEEPVFAVEIPVTEKTPARRERKLGLPAAIAAVAVVLVAVAVFLFTGPLAKQTLYLPTKQNVVTGQTSNVTSYDYDEEGRLLFYGVNQEAAGVEIEMEYIYDDKGRLAEAEGHGPMGELEAEYSYDKKGRLEAIVVTTGGEDFDVEIEYDKAGRIESMKVVDSEGEEVGYECNYSYHKDGWLEECEVIKEGNTVINTFDEAGRMVENRVISNGEELTLLKMEYDEHGNMTLQENIIQGQVISTMEVKYKYDKAGKVTQFTWDIGGQSMKGKVDEADEKEKVFELTGDMVEGDAFIQLEYDKNGNMEQMQFEMMGTEVMSYTYEYMELTVPKDYKKPSQTDPQYLLWLLGS